MSILGDKNAETHVTTRDYRRAEHVERKKKAGEGNRTLVFGLGSRRSTTELHPRKPQQHRVTSTRLLVKRFAVRFFIALIKPGERGA